MAKQYVAPEAEIVEVDANDGNRYSLPYGIAKGLGLDTTGMRPREVWEMLKRRGITPENEYDKLKEKAEKELPKEKVETVNPQRKMDVDSIQKSKAFGTLQNGVSERVIKNLEKVSDENVGIVNKYIGDLYEFTNGSGKYSYARYISFNQNSKGDELDRELGFDFDANTFFHEYGHFVDNMEANTRWSHWSDSVSVQEDAVHLFNELIKEGGLNIPMSSIARITREQKQAVWAGLRKVTGKGTEKQYKTASDFGYVKPPYKPTYTVEQAVGYFGEQARANAERLWKAYEEGQKAYEQAERDGTNAKAKQQADEWNSTLAEDNAAYNANLKRYGIVTDFMSIVTNDRFNAYKAGYYGHGGTYNKQHSAQSETWAEYFAFKMTNDSKGLDIMKRFLPKTYDAYEAKYKEIMEKKR
jgi:hypothetical protein